MPTPEINTGYKSPADERGRVLVRRGPGNDAFVAIPKGKRVFQFIKGKYQLQLTAPEEVKRSDGTVKRDRAMKVIADEYIKILDVEKDAELIKRLDEHPDNAANGGVDFWDFATVLAQSEKDKRDSAVKLLSDPTQRAEIIAALKAMGADDFKLPAVPKTAAVQPEA